MLGVLKDVPGIISNPVIHIAAHNPKVQRYLNGTQGCKVGVDRGLLEIDA